MQAVLNYGFDNYSLVHLYKKGDEVSQYKITNNLTIPVTASKDIDYDVPKGQEDSVSSEIKIQDQDLSKQSFNEGDNILKGTVYVNDKEYTTMDLAAGTSRKYEFPLSINSLSNNANSELYIGSVAIVLAGVFGLRKLINIKLKK